MIRGGRRPRRPKRSLSVKGNPVSYISRELKKKILNPNQWLRTGIRNLKFYADSTYCLSKSSVPRTKNDIEPKLIRGELNEHI